MQQTHSAGAVSLIPPYVTIKTPLVRKATGTTSESTSLEKLKTLSLVSATLEIKYAAQFLCAVAIEIEFPLGNDH